MKKSPLSRVKDQFKDKAGLVQAVRDLATDDLWVTRLSESKGLDHVSNQKLLHLHEVLSHVKKEFGSRSSLVDRILKAGKRDKDQGFRSRLEGYSTPRLLDAYRAAAKRAS